MHTPLILWIATTFTLTGFAVPSFITLPSDVEWTVRQSSHFRALYPNEHEALASRVLAYAEKAHRLLTPIFPESPPLTWLVLSPSQDSTNGYALDFPYPHIVLFVAPPEPTGQLSALDNWLFSLILHEYVHILHLYPAHGLWSAARFLFGSWVVPNGLMPTHFHEGVATLLETKLTQGGRGQGNLFRMFTRMAVKKGVWGTEYFASLDQMEASPILYPQGTLPYFFGFTLYNELWNRKGARGIHDLTLSYSSNWPYFLNGPLEEVYGIDYPSLWHSIFKKTTAETKAELETLSRQAQSELSYLTQGGFTKIDPLLSPDGKSLFFKASHPLEGSYLKILDLKTQQIRWQMDWGGGLDVGSCWLRKNGKDFILLLEISSEYHYSLRGVSLLDIEQKTTRAIVLDGKPIRHVHALACSDSSLLLYTEAGGLGKVLDGTVDGSHAFKPTREWNLPPGSYVSGLTASDPKYFTLHQGMWTDLYLWGKGSIPEKLFSAKADLRNLHHSAGKLFAIADIDGRNEIWEIFVGKKEARKVISVIGGIHSFSNDNGLFYVSSYEHGGYDIAKAKPIVSSSRQISSTPSSNEIPPVQTSKSSSYSPLSTLSPTAWVPSILFVPDGIQFGAWIPVLDVSQRHFYDLFGGYDTRGLAFANLSYLYRFAKASNLRGEVYFTPSYLIASQTFFKRWGSGVFLGTRALTIDWEVGTVYRKIESSRLGPANQSVGVQIGMAKSIGIETKPATPAPTQGTTLSLGYSRYFTALGSDDNYFSATAGMQNYLEAPWWDRHVWTLTTRAGYTEGTSFYNSYFEGGGELIFSQGRGFFLNRGFEPGLFVARRIFNASLEYKFPLGVVERGWGLLPAKLKSLSGAFIADTTTFDLGPKQARDRVAFSQDLFKIFYVSVGAELKSNWTFFFYLPTQIRLGLYHGFGEFGENLYTVLGIEAGL